MATSILFLTADPSNTARIRAGEELRDIQTRLRLAHAREQFVLHHRASVRPEDLSQAIFDTRPEIIHFSGHGSSSGELLLENDAGQAHPVTPQALEALFALCKNEVRCVILNACYSFAQAQAIAKHIDFVIGMNQAIGDPAAIAFSVGFYKALGAGRPIRECFEFGLVELQLYNISEYNIPRLLERPRQKYLFLEEDRSATRDAQGATRIRFPDEYLLFAKLKLAHGRQRGCVLVDPDAYQCIGHLLDDVYTSYLHEDIAPFSYGTQWLVLLGFPSSARLVAPWQWGLPSRDRASKARLQQAPMNARQIAERHPRRDVLPEEPRQARPSNDLQRWKRETSPASIGFTRGMHGQLVFAEATQLLDRCLIIFSNNVLLEQVLGSGPKAVHSLIDSESLVEITEDEIDADLYNYKMLFYYTSGRLKGKIFVDTGQDLAQQFEYWKR